MGQEGKKDAQSAQEWSNNPLTLFYVTDWDLHATLVSSNTQRAHQTLYSLQQAKIFMSQKKNRQWHWPNVATPQKDRQSMAETPLFKMTFCALTFTDQAIHWPAVASHHHLPPLGLRCPSCPSYWLRWCVSWEPRHRSLHQTAPDPPGRAAPGWVPPEVSGSHSSYLAE